MWHRLSNDRRAAVVAGWAVAGVVAGVMVSIEATLGTEVLFWLATIGGIATGAAIGLRGLPAVGAGLLGYGIAVAIVQTSGGAVGGVSVAGAFSVMLAGTQVWLWAATSLLLAAGVRYLLRGRRGMPGGQAGAVASAAGVDTPSAPRPRASRWAIYWLLAVLMFPPVNLALAVKTAALGPGPMLLVVALFIAGEGALMRRLIRPGARDLGIISAAGLVFGTTVLWSFGLFVIAIALSSFTY